MKKRWLLPLTWLLGAGAHAYEEPAYSVVTRNDDYEIRDYEPYLVAETSVAGGFRATGNIAFRRLAGYIFGDNQRREGDSEQAESMRMKMTVPVTRHRIDENGQRTVYRFVMERAYGLDDLPVPNDDAITLHEVPGGPVAVLKYRGRIAETRFAEQVDVLRKALARDGLEASGEPLSAVYNGPFTPPFLRRNEVMIPLATIPADAERN